MATNQPGAAGKFTGKIGQAVLSPWKGLHIARNIPGKSYKKPSIAQLEQRLRLGITSSFLKNMKNATKIGFPSYKKNMSNGNLALQHCVKNAVIGTYPNLTIDHSQIQLSKGDLAHVYNPHISTISGTKTFKLTWQNPVNLKLGVEEHDQVQLCLYTKKEANEYTQMFKDVAIRSAKEVIVPCNYTQSVLHIWMFLISADKKRASITKYLGKHTLQV